jgi:hypothetical protein
MLVDLPAGSGEAFEEFESEMGLIAAATEMGYGVTVVSVLSRIKDPVNALRLLLDFTGQSVQHIAVKNLYFGEPSRFVIFDQSQVKQQLLEMGGQIIHMDDLFDDTFLLLDEHNLSFQDALATGSPLSRAHRSRIYQWLKKFETEVETVGRSLGILI